MGSEIPFTPRKQEKMNNFTQTCNLFSQFLKERRSLGHVDAFTNAVSASSKNLENERLSLELFPFLSLPTAAAVENLTKNMANASELPKPKEEHKNTTTTPSMTIFYGGKVLVFDELPEEKALEILSLASRGTLGSQVEFQTQTQTQNLKQDVISQEVFSNLSELPIARRVSLHRFMEKRKHRIAASAPYQLRNSTMLVSDYNSQKLMTSLYEKQHLELKL